MIDKVSALPAIGSDGWVLEDGMTNADLVSLLNSGDAERVEPLGPDVVYHGDRRFSAIGAVGFEKKLASRIL